MFSHPSQKGDFLKGLYHFSYFVKMLFIIYLKFIWNQTLQNPKFLCLLLLKTVKGKPFKVINGDTIEIKLKNYQAFLEVSKVIFSL
jgi:hypothetical protein